MKIKPPWTEAQQAALNRWQRLGYVHEFTCSDDHPGDRVLVAWSDGWFCPTCGYKQDWAHDFMLKLPKNPMEER